MKAAMVSLSIAALLAAGISPASAQNKQANREKLDEHIDAVNKAAKDHGRMNVILQRVSTETGVPVEQIQRMHDRYPGTGPAGLLVACTLAAETKKSPEQILERHRDANKGWAAIARDNNVPIEKLTVRLDRLQNTLSQGADDNPKKNRKKKQ